MPGCGWCDGLEPLAGYIPGGATSQKLPSGGRVAFYNLERDVALRSSGGASLLGDMSALAAQDSGAIAAELPHIAEGAAVAGEGSEVVPSCPPTPDVLDQLLTAYSSDSDSQASSEDGAPPAPRGSKRASVTDGAGLAAAVTEALGDAQGLEAVLRLHNATRLAMPAQPGAAAAADAVLDAHIADLVADRGLDDTFYVMDLGIVAQLHAAWTACMPRVQPFYAVKCNGAAHHSCVLMVYGNACCVLQCIWLDAVCGANGNTLSFTGENDKQQASIEHGTNNAPRFVTQATWVCCGCWLSWEPGSTAPRRRRWRR